MSSYFRLIGRLRDNRALIKEIVNRLSKLERQVNSIETIDFRHFLRSNNDRIIYVGRHTTELGSVNIDPNLKLYQMPIEPDGDKLRCWIKFLEFREGVIPDSSGFNNVIKTVGSPETAASPVSGLPAVLLDGNVDRVIVENNSNMNLNGISIGFSVSLNFNPIAISLNNGKPRILAAKTDDDPAIRDLGWMIWVEPTGTIYFLVRIAGVNFTASYTGAVPALNKWYRLICTFDKVTNTPKIMLNASLSTEPVTAYTGDAELPSQQLDLTFGDDVQGRGKWAGYVADFRYWREKIISLAEATNYQNNNYTISNITWVARAGVGQFPSSEGFGGSPPTPEPPAPGVEIQSFTAASFTPLSFTVVGGSNPPPTGQNIVKVVNEGISIPESANYKVTPTGGGGGSSGGVDSFGIPKRYADSPLSFAPAKWEMGFGNYTSRITQWNAGSGSGFVGSGASAYFDTNQGTGNVRLNVYAGQDTSENVSVSNRSTMINRTDSDGVKRGGWMADGGLAENWRDCEITMALYLYNENGNDTCGWYCRGARHSDSVPCEGFKYEPNIYYAGNDVSDCNKETAHGGGGQNAKRDAASGAGNVGSIVGKWVFWKTIWRNLPQRGNYPDDSTVPLFPVNIQFWIIETNVTDPNTLPSPSLAAAGNWVKVGEWNDPYPNGTESPNWGNNPCGGVASAIGSWGGPHVTFRADRDSSNNGYGHIRIAYCSVREINPASTPAW